MHIALVAADELRISAGRARDRAALADLHLDIVHDRADRNVASGIALPGFTSTCAPDDHLIARCRRCGAMI